MMLHEFKPYPKMKDSGIEWIGKIPERWEKKRISWSFKKIGSGTTPDSHDESYYDGHIPWVNSGDLNDGIISETSNYITKKALEDFSALKIFPKNTLIIAMYGATIGKLGILDIPSSTNQACCNLFDSEDVHYRFLFYWFLGFRSEIIFFGQGGGQPNINQDLIKNLRVWVPEISEQKKISEFLDKETSKIDFQIQNNQKLIELLKEKRQTTINQAVTKGLDPTVPMKDSGIEWIGEIPEHWEVVPIKKLARLQGGFAFESSDFVDEGILLLKIANVSQGKIIWDEKSYLSESYWNSYPEFQIRINDILLAMTRPVISSGLKVSIFDDDKKCLLNQRVGRFILKSKMESAYFYFLLNLQYVSEQINLRVSETLQPNISSEDIENIPICFTSSLIEQKQISTFLYKETVKIDSLISKTETQIQKLQEYRQSLISAAVTGKIDVRNCVDVS